MFGLSHSILDTDTDNFLGVVVQLEDDPLLYGWEVSNPRDPVQSESGRASTLDDAKEAAEAAAREIGVNGTIEFQENH